MTVDQLLHDELKHMCETRRDIDTTESGKARWNAIIALIDAALAEPDADVAEAINEDINWMIAYISGGFGETWQCSKSKRNMLVAALRQMRSEPCEICGIEKLPDMDCHDPLPHEYWVWKGALWSWFGDYGGWEGSEISNCPNCGRKLVTV